MPVASLRQQVRPGGRTSLGRGMAARQRRVSLCETLDRVLNKGAVIAGDIVISVADVDLLYLGLNLIVTSVETMRAWADESSRVAGDGSPARSADTVLVGPDEPSVSARMGA